jgi:hypothetical protein
MIDMSCYAQHLFTCKKCKEQKEKDLFVKAKSCKNGIRLVCEKCEYEGRKAKREGYNIEWYLNNKQYRKEYSHIRNGKESVKKRHFELHKEWRKNNPSRLNEFKEQNRNRYAEDVEYKTRVVSRNKNIIENMPDFYIINRLVYCDGFKKEYLIEHPEIIETKRIILKTKRLCKTLQNSEQV